MEEPAPFWPPAAKFRDRVWLHVLLFVLTIASTTLVGGPLYSLTILLILGSHELGHYFACRYYDVDASLPFFLPIPVVLSGTMGAFIRIREPITRKHMLFDIGIAGPLAGFIVAVPALFLGVAWSSVQRLPQNGAGILELGEPLLFKIAEWVFWGFPPDGYVLMTHPVAFAAWFGMLATALNLFPIGQLDGGHITYAVLGHRSIYVTYAAVAIAAGLTVFSASWVVWTLVTVGMLFMFGAHHPRVYDEHVPLDRTRIILAVVALAMLVLCFTPAPIKPLDLIGSR